MRSGAARAKKRSGAAENGENGEKTEKRRLRAKLEAAV
jgi:hypothetical protein